MILDDLGVPNVITRDFMRERCRGQGVESVALQMEEVQNNEVL